MKSERECAASAASLCFQQALPVTLQQQQQQQQHSPLHSIGQQPQLLQPPPPPPPSIVLQHAPPSNVPTGLGAETPASDQAKLPPADGTQGESTCQIVFLYLNFQENCEHIYTKKFSKAK